MTTIWVRYAHVSVQKRDANVGHPQPCPDPKSPSDVVTVPVQNRPRKQSIVAGEAPALQAYTPALHFYSFRAVFHIMLTIHQRWSSQKSWMLLVPVSNGGPSSECRDS